MNLIITVTNPPQNDPKFITTFTFTESGGTIGRGLHNTFILKDKTLHVSKIHAVIHFEKNEFYIMDVSTNGTIINGASKSLSKGEQQALKSGDAITIGPYKLKASIKSGEQEKNKTETSSPKTNSVEKTLALDNKNIEDELSEVDLLVARYDDVGLDGAIPGIVATKSFDHLVDDLKSLAGGVTLKQGDSGAADIIPSPGTEVENYLNDSEFSSTVDYMKTTLGISRSGIDYSHKIEPSNSTITAESAAPITKQKTEKVKQTGITSQQRKIADTASMDTLLKSLGLHSVKLDPEQYANVINNVGIILNAAVDSLIVLLRDRSVIKNQLTGTVTTFERQENNPLKLSATASEALNKMLVNESSSYMAVKESFKESSNDLRKHQTAIVAASRRTYDVLAKRFDPEYLDMRLKSGKNSGFLKKFRSKTWGRKEYAKYHKEIEEDLQIIFDEAFRDAYSDVVDG